ncbi:acyltransferase family protein [Kineosporia sp. J2-2]|uniref:Acyltransferase family protein n=1 Tax=Kineosporia corallincola TaxID=2835133 RepID=A0ABS5TNT0_9ACTN|nr:acyltransferase [Kineosporia corallincola]MBT0772759.1 acyltransferase family protein [Kineosporia corallincola]
MVSQEPTPLPVRPRLDFEAGPVTGATLATGQIPVIDPQAGQTIQGQPVDPAAESGDEEPERQPEPRQIDDAAWTASLRVIDDSEWVSGGGTSGWSYPQIFDPDQPEADSTPPLPGPGPSTGEIRMAAEMRKGTAGARPPLEPAPQVGRGRAAAESAEKVDHGRVSAPATDPARRPGALGRESAAAPVRTAADPAPAAEPGVQAAISLPGETVTAPSGMPLIAASAGSEPRNAQPRTAQPGGPGTGDTDIRATGTGSTATTGRRADRAPTIGGPSIGVSGAGASGVGGWGVGVSGVGGPSVGGPGVGAPSVGGLAGGIPTSGAPATSAPEAVALDAARSSATSGSDSVGNPATGSAPAGNLTTGNPATGSPATGSPATTGPVTNPRGVSSSRMSGPPTAPTTVLPLRREIRQKHPDPPLRRSRFKILVRVLRGALGRRRPRPHRGGADPKTLGTRFKSKENHLGLIRLVLALAVGVTHATQIGYGWQPGFAHTGLGDLCVDGFFVLSGFLLVGSYLRLDSVRRYAWHRFLRIMPGFWVCLVVSATMLAPLIAWVQGVPMRTLITGQDSSFDYVVRNAALMMRQWGISGLPSDVEMAGVLNGSLWTLFYEAACYASIIALGVFGGLRRRPVMTLGAVGALWVVTVLNDYGILYLGQERIIRLAFMFLIGSVLYLYAHHVPVNRWLTLASAALVVAGIVFFEDYRVLAGPAFGYLCLALAVSRVRVPEPRTDISYGLYVYHWPLLQVFNLVGVSAYGIWVFAPAGLAAASVVALLSWKLVEKPALGFKDAGWVTWKLPVPRPVTSSQTT